VTRRLTVIWPDPRPFERREGRPIRLLAVSDDVDHALEHARNREALGPIDLIVGCGDLSPAWLSFVGDAFRVPIVYVRGNHDRQGPWPAPPDIPPPSAGVDGRSLPGIPMLLLPWTRFQDGDAHRDETGAWLQLVRAAPRLLRSRAPLLVVSHVPPRDLGDTPTDPYHVGYAAYRFLMDRVRPPLWLHGHTNPAAQADWRNEEGSTVAANVTGSVLVELLPPAG
jgi:DNA repair exonuclease SbcCD nuclease subunit